MLVRRPGSLLNCGICKIETLTLGIAGSNCNDVVSFVRHALYRVDLVETASVHDVVSVPFLMRLGEGTD